MSVRTIVNAVVNVAMEESVVLVGVAQQVALLDKVFNATLQHCQPVLILVIANVNRCFRQHSVRLAFRRVNKDVVKLIVRVVLLGQ